MIIELQRKTAYTFYRQYKLLLHDDESFDALGQANNKCHVKEHESHRRQRTTHYYIRKSIFKCSIPRLTTRYPGRIMRRVPSQARFQPTRYFISKQSRASSICQVNTELRDSKPYGTSLLDLGPRKELSSQIF